MVHFWKTKQFLRFYVVIASPFLSYQTKALEQSVYSYSVIFPSNNYFSFFPSTSFGDKDLDLRLSNPLHLRTLLEDKRFSKCRLVLLHASYPFSKEASYLASVYPQVKFCISESNFWTCTFDKKKKKKLGSSLKIYVIPSLSGVP